MKVELDPGEMGVAHLIATMRRCVNQSVKITDVRRDNSLQAIELDILGAVSELAWAKVMGCFPDLTVSPRRGTPDAIHNGKRVDIKATNRRDGRLLATTTKRRGDADIYVLAIVIDNVVDFVGYANADDLLSPQTIVNLGHGPTHALNQSQLRRFKRDLPQVEQPAAKPVAFCWCGHKQDEHDSATGCTADACECIAFELYD